MYNQPMTQENAFGKVLVLENDLQSKDAIKAFCEKNHLQALTTATATPLEVLKRNVDLSAIFLSDSTKEGALQGLDIAAEIHNIRPELPLYFRYTEGNEPNFKKEKTHAGICSVYKLDDIDALKTDLDANIFNQHYPNALLRGIEEITSSTILSFFRDVHLECSSPYLVKDRIIYGQLFSLIPVESNWCRGYMMLQADQDNILDLVPNDKKEDPSRTDFRAVNEVLSELTNLTWGAIKVKFMNEQESEDSFKTQIPIIINHENKYISFGTTKPQLCFQYNLTSTTDPKKTCTIFHKFVFNINWDPDKFSEPVENVETLIDSGDLEFF